MGLYIGNTRYCPVIGKVGTLPYDARIKYIEATGTQYIDTLVQFKLDMEIRARFQNTDVTTSARDRRYFGGTTTWLGYGISFSENSFVLNEKGNYSVTTYNYSDVFDFYYKNKLATIKDSTISLNTARGNSTSVPTIIIFGDHRPDSVTSLLHGRVYSFEITDVIDLVPVRVGQIGYMYDTITGILFGNSGTGNFVLGPDVI